MKMMIALDGSENGLRAAEYVARNASPDWTITLYHVLEVPSALREHGGAEKPRQEEKIEKRLDADLQAWEADQRAKCAEEIFAPAVRLFNDQHGGWDKRIQTKISFDFQRDVALDIIENARTDGYDTVVLGRRGRSSLNEFLFGSVTFKVVHHIRGCAVWIVE